MRVPLGVLALLAAVVAGLPAAVASTWTAAWGSTVDQRDKGAPGLWLYNQQPPETQKTTPDSK